mmetsp:Transcript_107252/g.280077  ORF Transcript_107252/g.280077 Transcript_107252/m.280077 type:complete len:144 (-) Transcript_107252:66-497(-)
MGSGIPSRSSPSAASLGNLYLSDKQKPLDKHDTTFGPMTNGSDSIHPQMHQTMAEQKFANTSGPGMDLLSCEARTAGTVTSIESAPMKLQNEETMPVRNSARSGTSASMPQTCRSTNAVTALRYVRKVFKVCSLRQFRWKVMV